MGSTELVDDSLSLEGHRRFSAHEMVALLTRVDEIVAAARSSQQGMGTAMKTSPTRTRSRMMGPPHPQASGRRRN